MDDTYKNQWEQLMLLKEFTRISGGIHEAQALQIQMWSYLAFDKISPSDLTIKIDINNKKIHYECKQKNYFKKYMNKINDLENNIKLLLGDSWSINI